MKFPEIYDRRAPQWMFWLYRFWPRVGMYFEKRWLRDLKPSRGETVRVPSGFYEAQKSPVVVSWPPRDC